MKHVEEFSRSIRRIILEQSRRANVGHIGSALSVADIVGCLYGEIFADLDAGAVDRDRFVFSKGHAALALYAALFLRGTLSEEELCSFCVDGTLLGVHPESALQGVDFSTGSLGQGLSVGAGSALAARLQGSKRRVFVLISDAECNEGSTWEAAMFASHHRLSNLVAILDLNGQQALGHTKNVLDLSPSLPRWESFGWNAHTVDGHDSEAITKTIQDFPSGSGRPNILIAQTVFGKGVSFMERQIKWHYLPMSEHEYARAMAEVSSN